MVSHTSSRLLGLLALFVSTTFAEFGLANFKALRCPFNATTETLSNNKGFKITYDTSDAKLAEIGPTINTSAASTYCYVTAILHVPTEQVLTFKSVETTMYTKLDEGVTASITSDFVWYYAHRETVFNNVELQGPHSGSWAVNQTTLPDETY
jgi:hypothetical protein